MTCTCCEARIRALESARDENAQEILRLRDRLWESSRRRQRSADDLTAHAPMEWDVSEFMTAARQHVPLSPSLTGYPLALRRRLVGEEALEFSLATQTEDYVGIIDAAMDLTYVSLGAVVSMGLPVRPFWREVHRSNMSKIGPMGVELDDRGKVVKGKGYSPPDIRGVLHGLTGWLV